MCSVLYFYKFMQMFTLFTSCLAKHKEFGSFFPYLNSGHGRWLVAKLVVREVKNMDSKVGNEISLSKYRMK